MILNPWRVARDERAKSVQAEERAAVLERQLDRAQRAFDESRDSEIRTLKIIANMGWQQAAGFTPFKEAASIPPRQESEIRDLEAMMGTGDARTEAYLKFRDGEMARFPGQAAVAESDESND